MHFSLDEDAGDNDRWRTIQYQPPPKQTSQANQGLSPRTLRLWLTVFKKEGQVFEIVAPLGINFSQLDETRGCRAERGTLSMVRFP